MTQTVKTIVSGVSGISYGYDVVGAAVGTIAPDNIIGESQGSGAGAAFSEIQIARTWETDFVFFFDLFLYIPIGSAAAAEGESFLQSLNIMGYTYVVGAGAGYVFAQGDAGGSGLGMRSLNWRWTRGSETMNMQTLRTQNVASELIYTLEHSDYNPVVPVVGGGGSDALLIDQSISKNITT